MKIITKRLILRDLKKTDAKDIHINANNIKIARYIPPFPHPYSIKDAHSYIKSCIKHSKAKPRETYDFGVTLKSENKVIGMISITKVDRFQGSCTMGYWLGEKYWRQGITFEALKDLINFAFTKLKLRRINIEAFVDNEASNALIKKMGFIYEGTRRKNMRDKATGKIHDDVIYGMLREKWNK